jgi:antirestriction protein ArdC
MINRMLNRKKIHKSPTTGITNKIQEYKQQVEDISKSILEQMQQTNESWEMPWHRGTPIAKNAYTGKQYGGNNLLILWNKCIQKKYTINEWATMYQWAKKGAKIRRGEKGTLVCFAIPTHRKSNKAIQLNLFEPVNIKDLTNNQLFTFRFRYVFNASQVIGYTPNMPDLFNPVQTANEIIKKIRENSGAKIIEGGEIACYRIINDEIHLPDKTRFKNTEDYTQLENFNATLIHELIHWTGHETRCKRQLLNKKGTPEYAFEELIAELGAAILSTQINQKSAPPINHANYLNSWIKVLKNDFSYFTEALELARTAIYFINKISGILPDLKPQYERELNVKNIEKWNALFDG